MLIVLSLAVFSGLFFVTGALREIAEQMKDANALKRAELNDESAPPTPIRTTVPPLNDMS